MLTYFYVRCALGQGSRGSLAKFSAFKHLERAKDICGYFAKESAFKHLERTKDICGHFAKKSAFKGKVLFLGAY